MTIQKPEWFRLDAAKFLSDSLVDAMSTTELGACLRLLCRQWMDGYIPDDLHLLARLCRLDEAGMANAWTILSQFFPIVEPGKRANRYMWIERAKVIADLERKSDEGTRAARKRWDEVKNMGNPTPIARPNGSPMPEPMQDQSRVEQTRPDHTTRDQVAVGPISGGAPDSRHTKTNPQQRERELDNLARHVLGVLGIPDSRMIFEAVKASISTKCIHTNITEAEAAKFIAGRGLAARTTNPPASWLGWFRDARYDQLSKQELLDAFIERHSKDAG